MRVLSAVAVAVAVPFIQAAQQNQVVAPAQPPKSSITWIGREAEIEKFLSTAKVIKSQDLPTGVTAPRRVFFEPGGPAASAVAKSIFDPGRTTDYYDSFRSEIAAYELDKVLKLGMVPPTVQRAVGRDLGSVQLWVEDCVSYKAAMNKPLRDPEAAQRQVRRMIVFDNLIVNVDRNEGNMLIDPAGNIILIDHSRSFDARGPDRLRMPFEKNMTVIDREFYERLKAVSAQDLQKTVARWVDFGIGPILMQRDAIIKRFERLIKQNGEANVIVE
jgi:hypothetical protein